ncbi:MAG: RNase P modulator RnpM [Chloroflexota bacterium]
MKKRKVPMRMCTGCSASRPKRELLRVVRTPQGEITVDPTGKVAGRGAYLCPDPDCLDKALRSKRLENALECTLSAETVDQLREAVSESAKQPGVKQ